MRTLDHVPACIWLLKSPILRASEITSETMSSATERLFENGELKTGMPLRDRVRQEAQMQRTANETTRKTKATVEKRKRAHGSAPQRAGARAPTWRARARTGAPRRPGRPGWCQCKSSQSRADCAPPRSPCASAWWPSARRPRARPAASRSARPRAASCPSARRRSRSRSST